MVGPDAQTQSLPTGLQLQANSSMAMYECTHQFSNLKLEHRLWSAYKWWETTVGYDNFCNENALFCPINVTHLIESINSYKSVNMYVKGWVIDMTVLSEWET